MNQLLTALDLAVPLVIAGILHMAVVKLNLLSFFNRPICEKTFGRNKTWRGFVVMPVATWLGVLVARLFEGPSLVVRLSDRPSWLLGLVLGLAYVLMELPNSWYKRRQGIAPGKLPAENRFFFFVVDHVDSVTGCVLGYLAIYRDVSLLPVLGILFLLGPTIHLVVSLLLYALGLRKEPF